MATVRYGIPGVGGSLGMCAVCGDTFLREILTGQRIDSLKLDGTDKDLPVHKKCAQKVIALQGPWKEIREKFPEGPIKQAFEEEYQRKEAEREPLHRAELTSDND
jgi:hypothetical protein